MSLHTVDRTPALGRCPRPARTGRVSTVSGTYDRTRSTAPMAPGDFVAGDYALNPCNAHTPGP